MLATWTEQARKRIPEAIRQAWSILVTVNEQNEVHAFKITAGADPLFATVKADKRWRIQDTAISADAMLPGGPYDLWRADEPSRRVKDLLGAFAQNPKLPKMLRQKEILDTIEQGVRDGIFVAALTRPDKSVRTFWRTDIDESSRKQPALELLLPEKGVLSELSSNVLAPGLLPGLWKNEATTVADVIAYFAGGHTVVVPKDGYDEPVTIPACAAPAVESAVSGAVSQGILWLVHGPASFQGEPVPAGVLTPSAQLLRPLPPISVDRLMQDAIPDAWKDGQTTAYALSVALAAKVGRSLPWSVVRRAIDDALKSRWIELATESVAWPCDMAAAAKVLLRVPKAGSSAEPKSEDPKGLWYAEAALEPLALQDLVDALPDVLKAAAGVPLAFRMHISIGDGQSLEPATIDAINKLLEQVSPDLRLKA
jgi:hypothetical protein